MQAIVETLFDAVYLVTVITLGIIMILLCGSCRRCFRAEGGDEAEKSSRNNRFLCLSGGRAFDRKAVNGKRRSI